MFGGPVQVNADHASSLPHSCLGTLIFSALERQTWASIDVDRQGHVSLGVPNVTVNVYDVDTTYDGETVHLIIADCKYSYLKISHRKARCVK